MPKTAVRMTLLSVEKQINKFGSEGPRGHGHVKFEVSLEVQLEMLRTQLGIKGMSFNDIFVIENKQNIDLKGLRTSLKS